MHARRVRVAHSRVQESKNPIESHASNFQAPAPSLSTIGTIGTILNFNLSNQCTFVCITGRHWNLVRLSHGPARGHSQVELANDILFIYCSDFIDSNYEYSKLKPGEYI
ncbi:unnamed protein product [Ambrosiozyma monospora]|uniref:Unnamed protein product n=1 Tax=Ambrosiozyma monospora TaxID=43982 RepID=A0A9W6T026_AMBMO|nr:unnamed protein product [Ambrosiozyma monospora]